MTTDLIPINNTVINQLPATFYCLITDTMFGMNISTDWYINGVPIELSPIFMATRIEPEEANTNLTILSLDILEPSVEVSCRTLLFPNATFGVYQLGKL